MTAQKHRIRPWVRGAAAFLALAFAFTFGAQSWITVKIAAEDQNAAKTYLAQQTGYANASQLERLVTKLRTLTEPDGLEDYYRLAETHIAAEEYDEALACVQRCLELYQPEYGTTLQAELLLKEGCLLILLGRGSEAETSMEQVLRLAPALADAYLVLAQIHAGSGETEKLTADLEGYLELQPGAADIRLLLAQLYLAAGQTGAALAHAEYLEGNGGQADSLAGIYTGAGLAKLQAQDNAGALELFERALALDDTVDSLCYYAGLCCLVLERYDEAVAHYTRAIELQSSLQMSHYGRGAAELMRAEPDLEQAAADLAFAAGYDGEDGDEAINRQAQDLLDTLAQ